MGAGHKRQTNSRMSQYIKTDWIGNWPSMRPLLPTTILSPWKKCLKIAVRARDKLCTFQNYSDEKKCVDIVSLEKKKVLFFRVEGEEEGLKQTRK